MKSTKTIFFGLLAVLGFQSNVFAQESGLSFSQAQDLMKGNNKQFQINQKKLETSQFNEKASKALSYPKFNAFAAATWMDKDIALDLNDKRAQVAGLLQIPNPSILGNWNFTLQENDVQMVGLGVTWPIYTGGKIKAAQNVSKIKTEIAKNENRTETQKLVSELAEYYYKAKLAQEAVEVRQLVFDGMQKHLYNAQKLEENGIIAGAETLQAKVAVANSERELLASKKDLDLAKEALASTMEVEDVNEKLSSPFFVSSNLLPLNYYQDLASNNFPQIEKLKLLEQLSEQKIKAEKANHLPTVAVFGQKILASNNLPLDNPLFLGVGVKYDLFDGFATKNNVRAAESEKSTLELARKKAELDIRTLVSKYYKELEKQEEQITSLEVSKDLAGELVRVRERAFSEGIANSVDVVDAQMNQASIHLQTLKAYSDYDITLAKLYEICGISDQYTSETF
ncbi:TolC family protein [Moheibacter lacus]|uniref:TolC family protein n=1 Tax=Moheibacter lacus TaxID=2745851 RepID=A0A838ZPB3_9FLAO|nr:TolC family protein [Moheibacter lacus]MBA5629900.1 TolC family protein [Moheibacter lacus]